MYYEIRVKGHLDEQWAEWFDPLIVTNIENGEALLTGELVDQAALHGILIKVRDLGLPLIAVQSLQEAHGNRGGSDADHVDDGHSESRAVLKLEL